MRLLLVSSSIQHGSGYLEHCADAMTSFFDGCTRIAFVPYALSDHDGYTAKVRARFEELGMSVVSVHEGDPIGTATAADGVFIGGGNTFRLLKAIYDTGLYDALRSRVADGMPYMGTSAGSNVATATICTTNDMPIVNPPSFTALEFVPFQINPHFIDADPTSTHMGETREVRIAEFHEESRRPVVGLREGSWLLREGDELELQGATGAVLFRRGKPSQELAPGADLSDLLVTE
ncbi:MAG: dipeptidase PepE [Planctomycetes bacterium]|nr:dipeptidase PepE [Planctomycetota bacterium]